MSSVQEHSEAETAFRIEVPQPNGTPLFTTVRTGEIVFVLGANGTGKSSLMHRFYSAHGEKTRRISAHRQTWFTSNAITLSPQDKRTTETNIQNTDYQPYARWRDDYSAARASIAIYNLIDAENVRARSITGAVDSENMELAATLSKTNTAPITVINELLQLSNIPIEISVQESEQVVASKSGSVPYSIAELSDGERNALLIAAEVLTVKPGTLILIDEPERHLHRSIISPLLTQLFARRDDCAFVVSTHDVMLPLDNPSACSLLVRGCTYEGSAVVAWDADLILPEAEIDDELKKDILGARRKLIFIEGTEQSLDKPLYSLIFSNVSIVAKSSCHDVENAVSGVRDAGNLNWLDAFGIVDNDRRTQDDLDYLLAKGVYALSVHSVESIYYHPEIQRRVVERHAAVTGDDALTRLAAAKVAALRAVAPHAQRLSGRAIEKALREQVLRQLPGQPEIRAAAPINISIDVAAFVAEETTHFQEALDTGNLTEIVAKYPVRETSALADIARTLGFQNREQYESAVLKLIKDDGEALTSIRSLFGPLVADLGTA